MASFGHYSNIREERNYFKKKFIIKSKEEQRFGNFSAWSCTEQKSMLGGNTKGVAKRPFGEEINMDRINSGCINQDSGENYPKDISVILKAS